MNSSPPAEMLEQAIDRFWETVPPLWNEVRSHIRAAAMENYHLTVEQFHILRHVRKGINSVSHLSAAQNISRPAVSQAVEALVQKGLLTRSTSARDRRCVQLALTDAGNALLNAVFQDTRAWMKSKLLSLNQPELETLIQTLETFKKIINKTTA